MDARMCHVAVLQVATEFARPIREVESAASLESVNSADSPSSQPTSTTVGAQNDGVGDSSNLTETFSGRGKSMSGGSSIPSRSENSACGIGNWMVRW